MTCRLESVACRCSGFSLVEMISVMVLVAILAALGGFFILSPVNSFVDQQRRAELTDIADNALQRMSRELRQALPNSVRVRTVGTRTGLEFLNTTMGGRYRARLETDGSGNPLVGCNGEFFDVLGGGVTDDAVNSSLVLYNTGTDYNAYTGNNVALITAVDEINNTITCTGGNFPFPIPPSGEQRFYVMNGPISYVCDTTTGRLLRYQGYAIVDPAVNPQPVANADFVGGSSAVLANRVQSCTFIYSPGALTAAGIRHGLVTLRLTVSNAGESVALFYQAHVANIP